VGPAGFDVDARLVQLAEDRVDRSGIEIRPVEVEALLAHARTDPLADQAGQKRAKSEAAAHHRKRHADVDVFGRLPVDGWLVDVDANEARFLRRVGRSRRRVRFRRRRRERAEQLVGFVHGDLALREQVEHAPPAELAELARELAALAERVAALEELLGAQPPRERVVRRSSDSGEQAARVRAVELSLAGVAREQIAAELAVMVAPGEVERLLDEVLSG